MVVICLFVSRADAKYSGGTGEPNNPYRIADANDMNEIGRQPGDWDAHFRLVSDINLSSWAGEDLQIGAAEYLGYPHAIAVDPTASKLYWTDIWLAVICRADADGTNIEVLISDTGTVRSICLDGATGKMYWTDTTFDKILRADMDGSNVETIISSGIDDPDGIVLDSGGGKIYWCERYPARIQRANFDGSGMEELFSAGLGQPVDLALDVLHGKIYWIDGGKSKLCRAALDGSDLEELVDVGAYAFAVTIDVDNGELYWTSVNRIYKSNLDGSNVQELIDHGQIRKIALDPINQEIFWTGGDTCLIYKAQMSSLLPDKVISNDFSGTFDGNGHQIANFTIDTDAIHSSGLFAGVAGSDAVVRNLHMIDCNITTCSRAAGFIAGSLLYGSISGCSVERGAINIREFGHLAQPICGSLVGLNSGTISDCQVSGTIQVNSMGDDAPGNCVGLFVGRNDGVIRRCSANGSIVDLNSPMPPSIGGLVGDNQGGIEESHADCTISAYSAVGGLAGYNRGNITNCYAKGSIWAHKKVGGLVGVNAGQGGSLLSYSYSAVVVDGNEYVGGFVGYDEDTSYLACVWDVNMNPTLSSIGNGSDPNVIAKTTTEMRKGSTFRDVGWDFVEIWNIGENQTYPFLRTYSAGDLDHNDKVNFSDVGILCSHWLEEK